jgi:hypothetical protein
MNAAFDGMEGAGSDGGIFMSVRVFVENPGTTGYLGSLLIIKKITCSEEAPGADVRFLVAIR